MSSTTCRVHKPGVPRGPASTPRLGPSKQHATHGPAQVPECQAGGVIQSLIGRSGREGTTPVCRLQPASPTGALDPVTSPPPDGLFDRKAWPKTPLLTSTSHSPTGDTPSPCSPLFSNWRDQSQLGSIDRGRPLGMDQETCREMRGEAHKSNHDTRDHTLYTCRNNTLQLP